ncbi:uncharacterized protein SPSK_10125 [Sporothrix schenckii 1099-18]|uniref:Uncharacterized protein n=1 Tax=Sporothrix schenckii 1099-18 TaxID=1397361 RepID=A0A0F2MAK8_SPOSC|nr:uncharacterized protein SPSK_10125 [Sporothrix schenckii 1099-18]KJR85196.1 hypothetical protein SPSK_10125 [Sporothrix schenckii 1099-18]
MILVTVVASRSRMCLFDLGLSFSYSSPQTLLEFGLQIALYATSKLAKRKYRVGHDVAAALGRSAFAVIVVLDAAVSIAQKGKHDHATRRLPLPLPF